MLSVNRVLSARLRNDTRSIVVTGAGGWLGRATLEALHQTLGDEFFSRVTAFGSAGRHQRLSSGDLIEVRPLPSLDEVSSPNALVLHYAYLTKEHVAQMGLELFSRTNQNISATVERFMRRSPGSSIFVPSSGAVYDVAPNAYAKMKRLDEARFTALATGGHARAIICRVFNLAGPCLNKVDAYALGSILRDIAQGGPIVLRANRPVFRSYVHVRTVIELALANLLHGPTVVGPFDTAGDEVVELSDLATRAAAVLGQPQIRISRPAISPDAGVDRYVGDGAKFDSLRAEYGIGSPSLDVQIRDTAAYLAAVS